MLIFFFISGCRTWLSDNSVKLLNLTGNGMEKLQTDSDKDVKSLHIMSMKFNFFKVKGIRKKQDDSRRNRWEVTIEVNVLLRMIQFSTYTYTFSQPL